MADVDSNYWGINGKINRTITSSNMTVSVTDYNGNDFSSLNPLVVKIGDTPRLLTGALSVTVNAGTNFFNLGATEFKTTRQDLFVYLGWRAASSTIFILLSRIPYGRVYADFSASQTNEKYGAFSGSTPASTDVVVNIGRVNAQNSGSGAYNWSLPAIDIIVNRPIFESEWMVFNSVVTGFSGTPTATGLYRWNGNAYSFFLEISGTSNAAGLTATCPFSPVLTLYFGGFRGVDNSSPITATVPACVVNTSKTLQFYKDWGASGWTSSGTKGVQVAINNIQT